MDRRKGAVVSRHRVVHPPRSRVRHRLTRVVESLAGGFSVRIDDGDLAASDDRTTFTLSLSEGVTAEVFTLADPYRVVIDLTEIERGKFSSLLPSIAGTSAAPAKGDAATSPTKQAH